VNAAAHDTSGCDRVIHSSTLQSGSVGMINFVGDVSLLNVKNCNNNDNVIRYSLELIELVGLLL